MTDNSSYDVIEAMNTLKKDEVLSWVREQLDKKIPPNQTIEKLRLGLEKLGSRFASGECFIPELILGGQIFHMAMDVMRPVIESTGAKTKKIGTLLIGTVRGDLHDLGQNLVSAVFSAGGFEVINLGKDVPTDQFIRETERLRPDILGLSSLLTTTMEGQKEVIEALEANSLRDRVKVIVGGAPVNQRWADQIKADAFGSDAIDGLRKAKAMLGASL